MAGVHPRKQVRQITASSTGLTTATTAYVSGDVLGGQLQFRIGDGQGAAYGELTQLLVIDRAAVIGTVELWLFSTAVTPAADNAAVSFSDADMQNLVGIFNCATSYTNALNKVSMLDPADARPVFSGASGILYGSLVTRSGHTFFGAASDLTVVMHFQAHN